MLLVPDSIHWITGTLARSFIAHNAWLDGTIISGPVLDIIAREQPDIFDSFDLVHFVCPYASRSWLPRLRERLPVVTSHHHVSDDWELQRHNLDGDAIVVGSSQWVDDIVERGASPERVACIPYGVDASRFLPATTYERAATRAWLGIPANAIVVGFFAKRSSNERDRKGTDIFSAAVQQLSRELPELAVLIIGPGWDELVEQLTTSGVKCVWQPFVRDVNRMPDMFKALDFYWVTARVEGGPVTLLEAMSTALCCITTPVGLAKEIVEDGVNGVMVPFNDSGAFAQHTLSLAQRPDKRTELGARARETILAKMDVPVTAQGVGRAYDAAIAHFAIRIGAAPASRIARGNEGLSESTVRRITLLEQLAWADALILQGQGSLAVRIMLESWFSHPFSSLPPRFLLRHVLPAPFVKALVRAKKLTLSDE